MDRRLIILALLLALLPQGRGVAEETPPAIAPAVENNSATPTAAENKTAPIAETVAPQSTPAVAPTATPSIVAAPTATTPKAEATPEAAKPILPTPTPVNATVPATTTPQTAQGSTMPKRAGASLVESDEERAEAARLEEKEKQEEAKKNEVGDAEKEQRKSGIARLVAKLTRKDGTLVPVVLLPPIDYTALSFGGLAETVITQTIARYGDFDIRLKKYVPPAITLEQFRKIVTRYKTDVVIICVLKPTNFDLFIYDRRTPYRIYTHSEVLPEQLQYQMTKELVEDYTKVIVRRALYAYMQDQFYELPRENSPAVLQSEIPRWIGSNRTLAVANRDILSSFYIGGSVGGTFSFGNESMWSTSAVGIQFGVRLFADLYLELGADFSAYNAVIGSLKYLFQSHDVPFRIMLGVGGSKIFREHTFNWDQNYTQWGGTDQFVVPSLAFSFPIGEVNFKVETKAFFATDSSGRMFSIMPGLFMLF